MIQIKSEKKNFGIIFPTSINEISATDLQTVVSKVKIPNNYCILALCFKIKLFDFVVSINNKKDDTVSVVPLLAYINPNDKYLLNAEIGDKVIINRSSLEMGSHLHINTMISIDNAKNYIMSDNDLSKSIITKTHEIYSNNKHNDDIIILEFKIVPISDIRGTIDRKNDIIDPYMVKTIVKMGN